MGRDRSNLRYPDKGKGSQFNCELSFFHSLFSDFYQMTFASSGPKVLQNFDDDSMLSNLTTKHLKNFKSRENIESFLKQCI